MAFRMWKKIESINEWIGVAARGLAKDAWVRVREETYAHYESAREESLRQGGSEEHAVAVALSSLGDARKANREYKKIHLTEWQRKLIWQDECVRGMIRARPYLRIVSALLVCGAIAGFVLRPERLTFMLLLVVAGLCFVFVVPSLIQINTRMRGIVYRTIKLMWLVAILWLPLPPMATSLSLSIPLLWMFLWVEWSRASARRKLPIAEWPCTLYL